MEQVTLSRESYDAMCQQIREKDDEIHDYRSEISSLKDELKAIAEGDKSLVIERTHISDIFGRRHDVDIEVKGFDEIEEEVTEHIKKGLMDKEIYERYDFLIKDNAEKNEEIDRLRHRSLWKRIIND